MSGVTWFELGIDPGVSRRLESGEASSLSDLVLGHWPGPLPDRRLVVVCLLLLFNIQIK